MKPALLSLVLATSGIAAPVWKQDGNRSVELSDQNTTLVRFLLDAAPRDPHFEILAAPDGRNTVWVGPPDHVWHYGVWFSWKHINGVNFWETDPKSGKQQGLNHIEGASIESTPDSDTTIIRYRETAHPDPDGPAVLEDYVHIKIHRPTKTRGSQVTWSITTKALADVILDRTPLPGEPDGRDWGGYGGFSWRGAKDLEKVQYSDSEDRKNMKIHRHRARWLNITGSLQGKPVGMLMLNHPRNPVDPASWYLFHNPKLPFWYANPALLQPKAISLKAGETFHHAYRIILHDGSWGKTEFAHAQETFADRGLDK